MCALSTGRLVVLGHKPDQIVPGLTGSVLQLLSDSKESNSTSEPLQRT